MLTTGGVRETVLSERCLGCHQLCPSTLPPIPTGCKPIFTHVQHNEEKKTNVKTYLTTGEIYAYPEGSNPTWMLSVIKSK